MRNRKYLNKNENVIFPFKSFHLTATPSDMILALQHNQAASGATGESDTDSVSKAAILALISQTPFDEIYVQKDLMTDDESTTFFFLQAMGRALVSALIHNVPHQSSPQKLLLRALVPSESGIHDPQGSPPTKLETRPEETPLSTLLNKVSSDNSKTFPSSLAGDTKCANRLVGGE